MKRYRRTQYLVHQINSTGQGGAVTQSLSNLSNGRLIASLQRDLEKLFNVNKVTIASISKL